MTRDLQPLLAPQGVAILGASADATTLRGMLTSFLIGHRYPGPIYLVTRSYDEILGLKTYSTIAEAPEAPDLAIVLVPAQHVVAAIEQCGARGVRAAAIISSGFGEEKTEAAADRDSALKAVAERYGMLISGPNSEGFVNPGARLVATFSPVFKDPSRPLTSAGGKARPIAVSCQSGALTFAFFSRGRDRRLRFAHQISAGNQTQLEAHDYIDWLIDHSEAEIFLAYLEGVRDMAGFRAVADKAARAGKPLIIAKVGRSDAGRRAAASHTGALAQAGALDDAVFRRHGVIRGEDLDHMLDVAAAFAFCKPPKGRRVAIITGSGGSAVWLADILSAHGLEAPELEDDIQQELMALLPPYASAQNPVDATAQAINEVGYGRMIEIVRKSKRVDIILIVASLANETHAAEHAHSIAGLAERIDQPILLSTYTTVTPDAMAFFADEGVPCYTSMSSCARAIRALVDFAENRARMERRGDAPATPAAIREETAAHLATAGGVLTEIDAKALLARYGVPRPREELALSADQAAAAAARIGGPVALKVQSPDIAHKTEAGAVLLGLSGEDAVRAGYAQVLSNARAACPTAQIQGVLVQAMAPPGIEIILGATRDPAFGPMLMVGLGGVHVEVLKDVAFAPVPLDRDDAASLLAELKAAALLDGVRGAPPADREALIDLMVSLSRFAADHADRVAEIDLNPVIVHPTGQGLSVVDALIVTGKAIASEARS